MKGNDEILTYKIILYKISNKMFQDAIMFNAISALQREVKTSTDFNKIIIFSLFFLENLAKISKAMRDNDKIPSYILRKISNTATKRTVV